MIARRTAILALAAFGSVWQCPTPAEAQNACMSRSEARRADPGSYLFWRGGPRGQRCWYNVASRKQNNRPGSINERPVSLTGQRADTVTGQNEVAQVVSKPAHNLHNPAHNLHNRLRSDHPGNTPAQGPVNILDHPTWAWVELARLNPTESLDPPPVPKGGLAQAILREHDLPGTTVYSSFAKGTEPEVWPDIKSYPSKQSTALWGAVVAVLVVLLGGGLAYLRLSMARATMPACSWTS